MFVINTEFLLKMLFFFKVLSTILTLSQFFSTLQTTNDSLHNSLIHTPTYDTYSSLGK